MAKFTHDCEKCTFLATIEIEGKWFDLYHCFNKVTRMNATIVARFSSEGEDYASGLDRASISLENPESTQQRPYLLAMGVGYYLAQAKGLEMTDF